MRRLARNNELLMVGVGATLLTTLVFALANSTIASKSIHDFFFQGWYVQATSTLLFFLALFLLFLRHRELVDEHKTVKLINIQSLASVTSDTARVWLNGVPTKYVSTVVYRRVSELLQGFLHKEEIISLNEELARRDREQIERSYSLLGTIRELIPVVGFLGTVLGLSLGMIRFPQLIKDQAQLDSLKSVLNEFAGSLSIAFNTTLLALAYTILVVIVMSVLRRREDAFLGQVDTLARNLLARLQFPSAPSDLSASRPDVLLRQISQTLANQVEDSLKRLEDLWSQRWEKTVQELSAKTSPSNVLGPKELAAILQQDNVKVLEKLEAIRNGLHEPPHYEILVQPIKEKAS